MVTESPAAEAAPVAGRREFAWGLVAQAFSSATNFGLTLLAGRLLGPSGLGTVVIGFGALQLVAALIRALVTQPIIAYGAPLSRQPRRQLIEAGLSIVACSGILMTLAVGALGIALGGSVGRAFVIFTPWIAVALLQEYWKAALFQEALGVVGALSEGVRGATMILLIPAALAWRDDAVAVGAWGVGTTAGLIVAVAFLPLRTRALRESALLWRRHAGELGRWLGAREVVYQILTYATIVTLAFVIGTRDLGGLRSAEALFSPFSLIAAALVFPALPALSRAAALSAATATRLAAKISVVATAFGLVYFALMALLGPWLLVTLFGHSFSTFTDLVWPMAVSQISFAAAASFNLQFSAENRGSESFAAGVVWSLTIFLAAVALGALFGVAGAAWGMALGAFIGSAFVLLLTIRRSSD